MRTAVFSLGNVLYGDDAIGPMVVESLKRSWALPAGLVVEDLGTPGFDLARCLADFERVAIVDAVHVAAAPGTIVVLDDVQICSAPKDPRLSQHDPVLADAISLARLGGATPAEVQLIGVQPSVLELGVLGLSAPVRAAVPAAIAALVTVLGRWGFAMTCTDATPVEPWWERAPAQRRADIPSRPVSASSGK
jgi:hydrogenase maturation protease